jgi:hypothetical protein
MTSVLARLGQWQARSAVQTLARPKKRKREDWICWRCQAQALKTQWRGYADDAPRATLHDFFTPFSQGTQQDESSSSIRRECVGRQRGRAETIHRGFQNESDDWGARPSPKENKVANEDLEEADVLNEDATTSQEIAQFALWERFEQLDDGVAAAGQDVSLAHDEANGESYTSLRGVDSALLDIDYVALLPEALQNEQVDLTARCIFAAVKSNDIDYIQKLPNDTFSRILAVLQPRNFIHKLASAHVEIGEVMQKFLGTRSMRDIALEYSQLVQEITALRRSGGVGLTLSDYEVLLRGARDLGNRMLSGAIWKQLHLDGHKADIACYNHFMAGFVFNEAHNTISRHKLRVTPIHMLGRAVKTVSRELLAFRVGEYGVKRQVSAIFRDLLDNGTPPNEESYRIVITAAAREGGVDMVKSILQRVWNIQVDAIMDGADESGLQPKAYPPSAALHPSEALLFTIAHAFSINNEIPTALRLVDFVARHYNLPINHETWEQLFEWTFVLSCPRTHAKGKTDGTRVGQLPKQSVLNLWNTMRGEPYLINPTMGMYNHLIANLFHRDMSTRIVEKIGEGLELYEQSRTKANNDFENLKTAIISSSTNPEAAAAVEAARLRYESSDLIGRRNRFWVKRWMRLLLGSLRAPSMIEEGDLTLREIPRLLWHWRDFAPTRVRYFSLTGLVEFDVRTEREIERTQERKVGRAENVAFWLARAERYVGDDWVRSRNVTVPKRVRRQREVDVVSLSDEEYAASIFDGERRTH